MKSAISRAPITASTGLSDSAQIVRGGSNLTTAGAVPYVSASGILNQDASNFFWDATNHRLGIGTNAPSNRLDVTGLDNNSATNIARFTSADGTQYVGITYQNILQNGSGGVLSFNINSRSSGNLNLNGTSTGKVSIGGGGGSVGIGPSNTSPSGTLHVYDATATTGSTSLIVQAGAGQSTNNLQEWRNNAGTALTGITSSGAVQASLGYYLDGGGTWSMASTTMRFRSDSVIGFASGTNATGTLDTSLSRISAGIVGVGTGSAGSTAGTLQAKSVAIISPVVPATAADAGTAGAISWDSSFIYLCTASGAWKRVAIATW